MQIVRRFRSSQGGKFFQISRVLVDLHGEANRLWADASHSSLMQAACADRSKAQMAYLQGVGRVLTPRERREERIVKSESRENVRSCFVNNSGREGRLSAWESAFSFACTNLLPLRGVTGSRC